MKVGIINMKETKQIINLNEYCFFELGSPIKKYIGISKFEKTVLLDNLSKSSKTYSIIKNINRSFYDLIRIKGNNNFSIIDKNNKSQYINSLTDFQIDKYLSQIINSTKYDIVKFKNSLYSFNSIESFIKEINIENKLIKSNDFYNLKTISMNIINKQN